MQRGMRLCPRCGLSRSGVRRISSRAASDATKQDSEDAMTRRLTDLSENAIKTKPKVTGITRDDPSSPSDDVAHHDALFRMRLDTNRLTYSGASSYTPISQPSSYNANFAKMDRKTGDKLRVAKAREAVAQHQSKRDWEKSKEYLALEEAYRPMPNSLEGLQSLAEERIDEARRAGAFKNLEGKGRPSDLEETKTPMVDRTEYFLNQIIKKQGALPPFVDAQASLDSAIRGFRKSLRVEWINFCCRLIAFSGDPLDAQIARAQRYGDAEKRGVDRLRDANWEKREMAFIEAQVRDLNNKTRGYNVIAPFNSRRGYLNVKQELENVYREGTPLVAQALIDRANAPKLKDTAGYKRKYQHIPIMDHVFGKAKLKSEFYERNENGYNLGEWFRDTFRRKPEVKESLYNDR